jgi:hypothetical protein
MKIINVGSDLRNGEWYKLNCCDAWMDPLSEHIFFDDGSILSVSSCLVSEGVFRDWLKSFCIFTDY